MTTERDPLLAGGSVKSTDRLKSQAVGPLEIPRRTRNGILAGLWSATFLSSLNTTLVATLLPSISSEFNRSNEASWLGTAYLLAACTFTPLYGRLCNVLGRRGANQLAVVLAACGTILCGLSGNMEMLIAARFIAGMGGGGILTTSTIITSDMFTMRERGLAQGYASLFNGLGMGLGGPIGGFINDWLGWRWAFLIQTPLYLLSLALTQYYLRYSTPGKSKKATDVLKRVDWAGSMTLLVAIGSLLVFLSTKFNEDLSWDDGRVVVPLTLFSVFFVGFILVELFVAPEPVLAPFLLKEKVPVLVGISNFFVSLCNFSIMYFFPMWFQTVPLTSASVAGLHLLPNSVSMSAGSMFAGWMMHKTGKYKLMNMVFGIFPFVGIMLILFMREDSPPLQMWLSIIPCGFGNAVVLQTMLIALLAHLPENSMAVGTGFGQVFRGIGQVSGVAVSSALFQSRLDSELRKRITVPDAEEIISKIRHSATLVSHLPPELQQPARDAYAASLRAVFILAACSTLIAYAARLPIPEKELDHVPRAKRASTVNAGAGGGAGVPGGGALAQGSAQHDDNATSMPESPFYTDSEASDDEGDDDDAETRVASPMAIPGTPSHEAEASEAAGGDTAAPLIGPGTLSTSPVTTRLRPRLVPKRKSSRLSTYENTEGIQDLESDRIGGSARQGSWAGPRSVGRYASA